MIFWQGKARRGGQHSAGAIACDLEALADELTRRPALRKVSVQSEPMTDALRNRIRQFAKDHPAASQVFMAGLFNVNQGRISEALRGKRT